MDKSKIVSLVLFILVMLSIFVSAELMSVSISTEQRRYVEEKNLSVDKILSDSIDSKIRMENYKRSDKFVLNSLYRKCLQTENIDKCVDALEKLNLK